MLFRSLPNLGRAQLQHLSTCCVFACQHQSNYLKWRTNIDKHKFCLVNRHFRCLTLHSYGHGSYIRYFMDKPSGCSHRHIHLLYPMFVNNINCIFSHIHVYFSSTTNDFRCKCILCNVDCHCDKFCQYFPQLCQLLWRLLLHNH